MVPRAYLSTETKVAPQQIDGFTQRCAVSDYEKQSLDTGGLLLPNQLNFVRKGEQMVVHQERYEANYMSRP